MLYLFVKWNIEVKHALRLKFLTQTAFHLLSIAIPEVWSLNQTLQGNQTKPNQIRAYLTLITSISSGKVCNFFSSTIYSLLRMNFLALRCASEKGDKCEVWIRANQTRQPNQTKPNQTKQEDQIVCILAKGHEVCNLEKTTSQNLPLTPHSLVLHNEGNLVENFVQVFFWALFTSLFSGSKCTSSNFSFHFGLDSCFFLFFFRFMK